MHPLKNRKRNKEGIRTVLKFFVYFILISPIIIYRYYFFFEKEGSNPTISRQNRAIQMPQNYVNKIDEISIFIFGAQKPVSCFSNSKKKNGCRVMNFIS